MSPVLDPDIVVRWLIATSGFVGLVGCGSGSPANAGPRTADRAAAIATPPVQTATPAPAVSAAAASLPPAAFAPVAGPPGAFSVRGVPPATRVSMSGGATCALTRDGAVWCWLDPNYVNAADTLQVHEWPMPIDGARGATALDRGCWLTDRVHCLGENAASDSEADPWNDVVGARSFSIENRTLCAIRQNGHVVCRGDNAFGQLGTLPANPHGDVVGLRAATDVSVGRFGACAVESPGTLVCWGAASLSSWVPGGRRLGAPEPKPTPPTALRGMHDVTQVSLVDGWHCLVRRTGRVHCWFPEDATTILRTNPLPAESEVQGISDAAALSGLLVLRRSGELAWVATIYDPPGNTTLVAKPVGAGVITHAIAIASEGDRACAVTEDGTVICWPDQND